MIGFVILLLHVLVAPFTTQARLAAELVLRRHQLSVLRQRVPSRPRLTAADRLLFVWLYGLFPSVLNALTIVQPETVMPVVLAQKFNRPWNRFADEACGRGFLIIRAKR